MKIRLQKFMSMAGVASRRHAEKLILEGKVKVNGQKVTQLGSKVDLNKDRVELSGKIIKPLGLIYLMLNKPKRYMTTRHDPQKRRTVFDLLPQDLRTKVWPVGRLDFNSEGLLILTNDGELTQILAHPSKEHEKEYEVELDKELSEGRIEKLRQGMMLPARRSLGEGGDGKKTAPANVFIKGTTVYITIHEGWNRQVRRMFSAFGYTVRNLKRIRIGKLKLGNLQVGQYRMISRNDVL